LECATWEWRTILELWRQSRSKGSSDVESVAGGASSCAYRHLLRLSVLDERRTVNELDPETVEALPL